MATQTQGIDELRGRRATVLGLAREGRALARFLAEHGARVTVSDQKSAAALGDALSELADLPLTYRLGGHPIEILDADVVFVSPGIPLDAPVMLAARQSGVTLSSETRWFCRLCPATVVGITGSSGKTTTATLVARMLEAAGRRVHLGGNIGSPLIGRLAQIAPGDVVVLELSSFQLDFFGPVLAVSPHEAPGPNGDSEPRGDWVNPLFPEGGWSPPVAAVLNVTPNHLDRHPSMAAYAAAKAHIVRHQRPQDRAVLNADDPVSRGFAALTPGQVAYFSLQGPLEQGAYLQGDTLRLRQGECEATICTTSELRLRGMHNVANVLAACTVVSALDVPVAAMAEVARSFRGVEHRLEPVREWQGVWYYNDSIATSPERAMAALRSFAEPIVLLAGGRDKHLPWEDWAELVNDKVVQVITFGEAAVLIETVLGRLGHAMPPVQRAQSLADAVRLAQSLARPGQVVLFSPGGTSFDAFGDYEERGRAFKQYVHALAV